MVNFGTRALATAWIIFDPCLIAPSRSALLAMNRPTYVLATATISTAVFLVVALHAIPIYGAIGASYAHIAFGALTAVLLDLVGIFFRSLPEPHRQFLSGDLQMIHIDGDLVCAHAAIDPRLPLAGQPPSTLLWERPWELLKSWSGPQTLVLGHTPTHLVNPAFRGRPLLTPYLILADTGVYETAVLTAIRWPDRTVFQSQPPTPSHGGPTR